MFHQERHAKNIRSLLCSIGFPSITIVFISINVEGVGPILSSMLHSCSISYWCFSCQGRAKMPKSKARIDKCPILSLPFLSAPAGSIQTFIMSAKKTQDPSRILFFRRLKNLYTSLSRSYLGQTLSGPLRPSDRSLDQISI
jgi:hypothetical protein